MAPSDTIDIQIVSVLVPAEVVDLSFGGFSVETRCSLRIGAMHAFRFTTASGRTIDLDAQIVYCRRKETADWSERYITGCEFVRDHGAHSESLVEALMDSATGVLSFE